MRYSLRTLPIPLLRKNRPKNFLEGKESKFKTILAKREPKPLIEEKGKNKNYFAFARIYNEFKIRREPLIPPQDY